MTPTKTLNRLILVLLLLAAPVWATPTGYGTCSTAITVETSATTVIAADDVPGGRHYLSLQNIGANPAYCRIGGTATATNGFLLPASGGALIMVPQEGPNGVFILVPSDLVSCIATGSSTTVVYCDY